MKKSLISIYSTAILSANEVKVCIACHKAFALFNTLTHDNTKERHNNKPVISSMTITLNE